MANILIVDDTNDINDCIKAALTASGYACDQAYSGTEGLLLMKLKSYDCVVLDLMLPGMSGEEVLAEIKSNFDVPVIVSSAKGDIEGKINCLEAGADDYVTKPFDLSELTARVGVQLRKHGVNSERGRLLTHNELSIDTDKMQLFVAGNEVELTKHEFNIIELLMRNPGKVFSKQAIYEKCWEEFFIGEDKTVNVHISNLRKKIKQFTDADYIDTVWGTGFRLK